METRGDADDVVVELVVVVDEVVEVVEVVRLGAAEGGAAIAQRTWMVLPNPMSSQRSG